LLPGLYFFFGPTNRNIMCHFCKVNVSMSCLRRILRHVAKIRKI
jgi:hypothetical protein